MLLIIRNIFCENEKYEYDSGILIKSFLTDGFFWSILFCTLDHMKMLELQHCGLENSSPLEELKYENKLVMAF